MTKIKFTAAGQRLKRITFPYLVRDSKNHIRLDFEFMTKGWAECEKKAIFDGKYEVDLIDDSVLVPVTQSASPEFTVSIYGVKGDTLITTNELTIQLNESGYVEDTEFPPDVALEEYKKQVAELEAEVEELQASIKPEQEKTVDITENGTTEITPDENKTLSKVTINVDVPASGDTAELENLIDESGVLDSTDGTATEKVEQLIDKADLFNLANGISFRQIPATVETFTFDCATFKSLNNCFGTCFFKRLYLLNTQNITDWRTFLGTCNYLETLETLDLSNMQYFSTNGVPNLKNIKFAPKTINNALNLGGVPKISDESIQSLIDGLDPEQPNTVQLHSDAYGKLTQEQWDYVFGISWDIV